MWPGRAEKGGKALAGPAGDKGAAPCTRGEGCSPPVQSPTPPSPSAHFQPSCSQRTRNAGQLCVLPRGWQTGTGIHRSGLCPTKGPLAHTKPMASSSTAHILSSAGRGVSSEGACSAGWPRPTSLGKPTLQEERVLPPPTGYGRGEPQQHRLHASAKHRQHYRQAAAQELCQGCPRVQHATDTGLETTRVRDTVTRTTPRTPGCCVAGTSSPPHAAFNALLINMRNVFPNCAEQRIHAKSPTGTD